MVLIIVLEASSPSGSSHVARQGAGVRRYDSTVHIPGSYEFRVDTWWCVAEPRVLGLQLKNSEAYTELEILDGKGASQCRGLR